ncbi:protein kinase [Amycolatopsis sp. OK19-0408]|uniref:non-specific serine/threonine protein kinase n=2 Tax=Amycolatopsis iheyensis TaxID=2945988 RepID=A0A9X2NFT0_9PSEU|nr:protein kinase [Amycolatopsis iheyensis]
MGVVWRATDVRLERTVAIKQILPQPGVSETERDNMRQRAMREAKNAARFQHPNAIVVFDIAEHNGDPCLVMEYLNGPSLSTILAEEGTLPLGRIARIGEQVASALVAAHRAGIVHRDVKPGNILIDETGTAKITDFGISRAAGDMTLTATGLIGGTPAYLAPELARGADPVPSSDVFALGATLYQAIEGTTPYGNTTNQLALLYAAANGQINPPVQAGGATALLMSLLRSEPGERPSMAEARERLAALARTEPGGTSASPQLLAGGVAGRKPAAPADGGERPPWQRTDQPAPQSPPVGTPVPANKAASNPPRPTAAFMPMRSPAAPPNTPPRPMPAAAPSARAPQYSSGTSKPDNKRKYALFAGAGAAVVVVAVIVFLVLNSSSGGGTGGSTNAQSPGNQSTSGPSSPSTGKSSSSNPPAALGQTKSEGRITAIGTTGQQLVNFFNAPADNWAMLTPAAQAVYGDEQQFQQYWAENKKNVGSFNTARTDEGVNSDGSVQMYLNILNGRHKFRMVIVGGQTLIDANTKIEAISASSGY